MDILSALVSCDNSLWQHRHRTFPSSETVTVDIPALDPWIPQHHADHSLKTQRLTQIVSEGAQ